MLQCRKPSSSHALPSPQARRAQDDGRRGSTGRKARRFRSTHGGPEDQLASRSGRGHRRRQRAALRRHKQCDLAAGSASAAATASSNTDKSRGKGASNADDTFHAIDGHRQHRRQDGPILSPAFAARHVARGYQDLATGCDAGMSVFAVSLLKTSPHGFHAPAHLVCRLAANQNGEAVQRRVYDGS